LLGLRLSVSKYPEDGSRQDDACKADIPGEEEHTETIDMRLIIRRRVYAMDRRLEEVSSEGLQRIADVDRDGLVLRLDPLPLLL
jgi:hypothetical protein